MTTYFLRRIFWLIPVIVVVSAMTFIIMRSAPGSPWDGGDENRRSLDPATQKALEKFYGLDKPMWRQFTAYTFGDWDETGDFTCGAMCGNLGPS